MFTDLDPGQGDVAPPGCIGATTVDVDTISVEEGASAAGALVYFFGHASPGETLDGFKRCVDRLAATVEQRFEVDHASKSSGMIINTCGWTDGQGYRLLLHAASAFKPNVVLVLGDDRLLSDFKRDLSGSAGDNTEVNVLKIPTSGGATVRSREYRKHTRDSNIRNYFYGSPVRIAMNAGLSPAVITVSFDDVTILRGPTKDDVSDEAMRPVGKTSLLDPNRPRVVEPTKALQHSLLAVSHAHAPDDVLNKNVAGFVHVQTVNVEERKMTLLSPQQGALPNSLLVMGSVKWVDE